MSIDHISTTARAHRLGADAQLDRFDAERFAGLAGAPDEAALVLDGALGVSALHVGAPEPIFGPHDMAVADPNWTPTFTDYGMMPLDNTKPHKTVAEAADQLTRGGYHWNSSLGQPLTITYSFRQDAPTTMPDGTSGFSQFNADQIAATKIALQAWMDVARITFVQVSDSATDPYTNNATILYANYSSGDKGAAAFGDYPNTPGNANPASTDGDVWVNNSLTYNNQPLHDQYGSQVLLHETGHALGLQHPGDYNAGPDYVATYQQDALYYEDSNQYTVMSYFSETNTGGNFYNYSAESPLMDDIAAMQKLYGANTTAFSGDTTYGFNCTTGADYRPYYDSTFPDKALIFCAYDTGGNDTFDFSGYTYSQLIDLNTGHDHFSDVGGGVHNVSIFDGTVIENGFGGGGNDHVIGNDANNVLAGNDGADTLVGGAGGDTLSGGAGADNLNGGDGNDELFVDKLDTVVTGGAGEDEADINSDTYGATSFSLYDGRFDGQIEDLYADGSTGMELDGTAVANHIRATDGADLVKGMEGNDTLIGRSGADTIYAGTGDDTVWGGTFSDLALVDGGDKIYGEDGNDLLNGNLGNDTIDGGAGNDTIYGGANDDDSLIGGAGNDSIDGGSGNDTIDGGADNNVLIGGAGADLIRIQSGSNSVDGGADTDELDFSFGGSTASVQRTGAGSGTISWGSGVTSSFTNVEDVRTTIGGSTYDLGSNGQIFYVVPDGRPTIHGGAGTDILVLDYTADGNGVGSGDFSHNANGYSGSFGTPYNSVVFDGIDIFQLKFSDGSDNIQLPNAPATINSAGGDDFINSGTAVDSLIAGSGNDGWTADLSAQAVAVNLDLTTGTYTGPGSASGFEFVGSFATGSKNDIIKTGAGSNSELISTNAGNDTVTVVNGRDTVHMGAGTDTLIVDQSGDNSGTSIGGFAYNGADGYSGNLSTPYNGVTFDGVEVFKISTGSGGDNIAIPNALATINTGGGDDFINSGTAVDSLTAGTGYDGWTADLSAQAVAVNLDLTTGTYTGPGVASGFEYVGSFATGSKNDVIKTGAGSNSELISTNGGNDTVTVINGRDTVHMGAGTDTLIVDQSGDNAGTSTGDSVSHGADGYSGNFSTPYNSVTFDGVDVFNITTGDGGDYIALPNALATINTGGGDDFINSGTAIDSLTAGAGSDGWSADLSATSQAITLDLTAGTYSGPGYASGFDYVQTFSSGSGADLITTGDKSHSEAINTNAGNDTVTSVNGRDTINLGTGTDTLIVNFAGDGSGMSTSITGNATDGYSGSFGTPYNSVVFTGGEIFKVTSGDGGDNIAIGNAVATISTGLGDDFIDSGTAVDSLTAGTGFDGWSADLSAQTSPISLDLSTGVYSGPGFASGFEYVGVFSTGSGADMVKTTASGRSEAISTGAGDDVVYTVDGRDTVHMGTGTDTLIVDLSYDGSGTGVGNIASDTTGFSGNIGTPYNGVTFDGVDRFQLTTGAGGDNIALVNATATINTGAGDDFINSGIGIDSLTAGAGADGWSADLSAATVNINLDLSTGTYSGPGYASGFEYVGVFATGSGNDVIKTVGGGHSEAISTNGGNDTVAVVDGRDTVHMGAGSDRLIVDFSYDGAGIGTSLTDNGADGFSGSYGSPYNGVSFDGVESFFVTTGVANDSVLTGSGDDQVLAGAGLDTVNGGAGNDTLDGGVGADTLYGGLGNDLFMVDDASDVVVENAGEGRDVVQSLVSYTLAGGAEVEVLTLAGSATSATGNAFANTLNGNALANTLDGGGGVDTLVGGGGNDTYIVDSTTDTITELAGGGVDTIQASVTFTSVANVEFLVLTGTADINGFGDSGANTITGNDGANSLAGGNSADTLNGGGGNDTLNGGLGADSLSGGLGDDTYIVDNLGDVVTEAANAGLDWVQAAVDFVLGANVENLSLSGAAVNGTGNTLANEIDGDSNANSLVGGSGADTLNGAIGNDTLDGGALSDVLNGGTGADSMIGGTGNDTFVVDNTGDQVVELAGAGTDTVQSSITYTLGANVENLTLTGNASINGTGNDGANTLKGNAKDNVLEGGLGDDVIVGGKGFDIASYEHAGGGVNVSLGGGTNSGAAGADTLSSIEGLTGSAYADSLTGSSKGDVLNGGAGADTLTGGLGADTLTGGADADRFVFTDSGQSSTKTPDRITDLTNADVIDLHLIDANSNTAADDPFTLVSAFTHQAGQLVLSYSSATGQTLLQGDTDGDGKANFAITLDGNHTDFTNFAY